MREDTTRGWRVARGTWGGQQERHKKQQKRAAREEAGDALEGASERAGLGNDTGGGLGQGNGRGSKGKREGPSASWGLGFLCGMGVMAKGGNEGRREKCAKCFAWKVRSGSTPTRRSGPTRPPATPPIALSGARLVSFFRHRCKMHSLCWKFVMVPISVSYSMS